MSMDDYLIPYKAYVVLKWVGLIVCPALATFIGVVGSAWGLSVDPVITTITAFGTFIGALLKYSETTGNYGKHARSEQDE